MSHLTVLRNRFRVSHFLSGSIRAGGLTTVLAATITAGVVPSGTTAAADSTATPATVVMSDKALAPATRAERRRDYGRLPLLFEPNQGQSADAPKFLARGPGYALFLTEQELVVSLRRGATTELIGPPDPTFVGPPEPPSQKAAVLRLGFVGANPQPVIEGRDPLGGHSNYFLGNDPAKWRTGIPHYGRVRVKGLYPGIDLVLYGNPQQLEYDFAVAPGADPGQIRLRLSGAKAVRLNGSGDLVLDFPGGTLTQRAPTVYQVQGGERRSIEGGYRLLSADGQNADAGPEPVFAPENAVLIEFQLAAYDPNAALVIDPVLAYSTYLGGSYGDIGNGIALDGAGNVYLTGYTSSLDFPTVNAPYPDYSGGTDAFVAKLNADGTALAYSTYLGGSSGDYGYAIAVDSAGNAYLTGDTRSPDFPTVNGLYPSYGGGDWDAFVAKLNADGTVLVYSTYLGGTDEDGGGSIAADSAGNAYVTGDTQSPNFPTANALYPDAIGGWISGHQVGDVFVTKLNAAGTALVYSTYLGGTYYDWGYAIATDDAGNAYVTGMTGSLDFPTVNALYPNRNRGYDAFVAKLNAAGTALVYSTYLGGFEHDRGEGIATDSAGNAYVTGVTGSFDFPTVNAPYPGFSGGTDAYVAKLNADGTALVYSTFLGGNDRDYGYGIAVDGSGNAYVTGRTDSRDFPAIDPLYLDFGTEAEAFVAKLNAAGTALVYSTYLGGSELDYAKAVAVDDTGNPYVAGLTASPDFPIANALYPYLSGTAGGADVFVAKIDSASFPPWPTNIGVWRPARTYFLLDTSRNFSWDGAYDLRAIFGTNTDMAVTGDWNGDGFDEIGVWRPVYRRFLLDRNGSYTWSGPGTDLVVPFGTSTDLPVAGDWNGDGFDDVGVWRPSNHRFFLDSNGNHTWDVGTDLIAEFGASTDLPVIGDWNGDGIDDIGVWRPSNNRFFLDTNGNHTWEWGTDLIASFGIGTDLPVIGDWNDDGIDDIGIWRPAIARFYLDANGNYTWDVGTDLIADFGESTDLPITGRW